MRPLVTCLLLLGVGCATEQLEDGSWDFTDGKGDGQSALSYGALATSKVPVAFDTVKTNLVVLDADVLPHEAKAVRKQLAELRDHVDLFVFAYPTKDGDPWNDIRDQLDEGYETIGAFKDLFDRQGIEDPAQAVYDDAEVAEHRDEVLAWFEGFTKDASGTRKYLAKPSQNKLHDRDRDDLSPFFWGATKIEPSTSRSGLKNMAKLTRELLELAVDDYDKVLDIRSLHVETNQEKFHDFRKRVRSIARLPVYFPQIMDPDDDVTEELATITEAVDRYGSLNDKISKHAKDPDKDLEDEIRDEWKALRDWQREHDFDRVLDKFHDAVRK